MDTLRRWYRDVPVTTLATLAAVVVWIITAAQSGSIRNSIAGSSLAESWLLWGPYVSTDGLDWFRALGAVFLHIDAGHLAINCIMLALIGREIECHLGTALYAAVFLTGGIGASAAVLWLDYDTPTAGASGVVFALMVLLVGVNRLRGGDLRAPLALIAVNVAYTLPRRQRLPLGPPRRSVVRPAHDDAGLPAPPRGALGWRPRPAGHRLRARRRRVIPGDCGGKVIHRA
ncbi:rhomboid family intramembrane serine protease [Corynebacterium suedekumii]|nr:rhomboid family intramembrane serine protease [Corynebacterium suedekumii]